MLESMRNHAKSWVAKIILGGIALSFVLWGIGDYFLGGHDEPVASIDGKPISNGDFYRSYQRQMNAYRAMLGKNFSKDLVKSLHLKESTLQTIINRQIMLKVANDLGLVAPANVVLASVESNPQFQSAGVFDPKRYKILTRNMGFGSAQDYENDLRLNIIIEALQKAVRDSVYVSDAELRERYKQKFEQRVLAAIVVDPASLLDRVTVSDTEAQAWYKAHSSDYMSPLRVKVNMVEIDPKRLAQDMSVDDAEIQAAYDQKRAEFTLPEERKARHILIKVAADADQKAVAAAKQKIEMIAKRLNNGDDFAALAKQYSEGPSAKKGGELGWFKQGTMVPEFDQAVFSMDKGDVSKPVKTQFGYHLIQLEDIHPQHVQTLAEVKGALKAEIARARAADEAYKLSQDLDDALGMEDSLKAAADAVNLKMVSSDLVSQREAEVAPILSDPQVRKKAFSTLPDQPVDIIETADGRFVALEVVERKRPEVLPYAQVKRKVMADAKSDAADRKARETADQIRAAKGKTLDALAQQFGQPKYISKPLRSDGSGDKASWINNALLAAAFVTPADHWLDHAVRVPQGYAAVRVSKVIAASEKGFAAEQKKLRAELVRAKGDVRFSRWMAALRDRYKIEVNQQALARF